MPHDTSPIRAFLPSIVIVRGPPESPCKQTRTEDKLFIYLLFYHIVNSKENNSLAYLAGVATTLFESRAEEHIVNGFSPARCPKPALAAFIGYNFYVYLLENSGYS